MGRKLIYKHIAVVILILAWVSGIAQPDLPLTNDAAVLYQNGDLVAARETINRATLSDSEKNTLIPGMSVASSTRSSIRRSKSNSNIRRTGR